MAEIYRYGCCDFTITDGSDAGGLAYRKGVSIMSSVFWNNHNYFNGLFGNTSNNSGLANSLFGGGSSNMLSDYSMIKSGAYKKLLTAYYKSQDDSDDSTESTTNRRPSSINNSKVDSKDTSKLLAVKSDSEDLKSATNKLADRSLYRATGEDEDGNDVYDRDKITKNVKEFVSAYNKYLDSSSSVNSQNILKKSLSTVKLTASNKKLLSEVGINIGADNKLTVDEKKLSEAKMSTLSSLFTGSGSYANTVGQKASETYRLANSATYSANNSASYNFGGSYSMMGTSNNSWDKYF